MLPVLLRAATAAAGRPSTCAAIARHAAPAAAAAQLQARRWFNVHEFQVCVCERE
jgi:hypothetical protein